MSGFYIARSLFARLMLSFVLIILIVLSTQFFSYEKYFGSMEKETIKNTDERLDNLVNKLGQYFKEVHATLVEASVDKAFSPVSNGGYIDNYDEKLVSDMLVTYKHRIEYVNNIVLINRNSAFVVTPEGTFMKNEFFNRMYFNESYTEDYWEKETTKNFIYNYYPAGVFKNRTGFGQPVENYLLPFVIKKLGNSNYILIAFIDVKNLTKSIEGMFFKDVYIFENNKDLIFPGNTLEKGIELPVQYPAQFQKVRNIFLFYREKAGLSYYKVIPYTQITDELKPTRILFLLVIFLSLAVSLLISIYLARKFNSPVKQIMENMRKMQYTAATGNITDLKLIGDRMQEIIHQNYNYINDINRKDAAIKSLSYYAKVKNINFGLNELLDELVLPKSFLLLYFKIHYRESFFSSISEDKSRGAFFIKEIIQIYLSEHFSNAVTCQIESDQILSIVETERNDRTVQGTLEFILEKLNRENDYIFFTVVVSNICNNISEIDKVYGRVTEIVRYRKLVEESQILTEEALVTNNGKLYFNIEQGERFANSLCGKSSEECISQMKNILSYNVKKGVGEFYIKLLSMELVSCCVKVLTEVFFEVPDNFKVTQVYNKLEHCSTLEEYENVLQDLIISVVGYLKDHKKESDYIIDFVKQYIEAHFMKDISLELLADKLNITKNYLSAYFKSKMGVNLSDYINNFRIKKSIELMEDPSVKIHEAGISVGIPNTNTFIRLFRKYTGKAPGEYRRSKI